MIIPLGNEIRAEVIDSVLGQLSDGIWENSNGMNKYWMFADVDGTNLSIDDESYRYNGSYNRYGCRLGTANGFTGKNEKQIKDWFANKAKQVVKIWAEDYGKDPKAVWDRNNTDKVGYMGGSTPITVADVYECYDFLKGRSGKKYATTPIEEPEDEVITEPYEVVDDVVEPKVSGGMHPSQQDVEDFFLDASTSVRRNSRYVRAADDILSYGKCIGYGVDYRNMHTAIHGILVFSDIDEAEQVYDQLKQAEQSEDDHEYAAILNEVFEFAVEDIDEINFRDFVDVGGDKIYPVYDDEFIIIVNDFVVDLYL